MLVYRNTVDLGMFFLYPMTSLSSFISSSYFFVDVLGFPVQTIMLSANVDCLISSFLIGVLFLLFSYFIALAGTPSTMSNSVGHSRCPGLVLD